MNAGAEMGWKTYTLALLLFNTLGVLVVYGLQRLQAMLPKLGDDSAAPKLIGNEQGIGYRLLAGSLRADEAC